MKTDQQTLNFAAAVLCGVGSFAALVAAFGDRKNGPGAALLSGLAGTIGSAAWAMAAYQDIQQRDTQQRRSDPAEIAALAPLLTPAR